MNIYLFKDYVRSASESGFKLLKTHIPVGNENEEQNWLDEKDENTSPWIIYVWEKN